MTRMAHRLACLTAAAVTCLRSAAWAQEHQHEHPMMLHRDQVRVHLVAVQATLQRAETALKRSQGLAREWLGRVDAAGHLVPGDSTAGVRVLPAELAATASQLRALVDRTRITVREASKPPERTKPGDADPPRAGAAALEERNRSIHRLQADADALARRVRVLLERTRVHATSDALPFDAKARLAAERLQRELVVVAADCDQARRSLETLVASLGLPGR